jgi:T5orf172 domain
MPFIPHTPESLLSRSDSKNPAATCRGLTANGRPCRRPVSKAVQSSPGQGPEAFCWQHKDQYIHASLQGPGSATIRERTSADSLADRLGLLELKQRKKPREPVSDPQKLKTELKGPHRQKPKLPKPRSSLALLCCIGDDDHGKAPRLVKPGPHNGAKSRIRDEQPQRPKMPRGPSSRELLSLIPSSVSPQTAALLLAELAKPVSAFDEEGYIYMFWLTPDSLPSTPPSEAASSLLSPPETNRRASDILNSFVSMAVDKRTILLKIGRTQNVQRRLNQWTRQCGYNLSLIRYYPYHPSLLPANVDASWTPRKVPNVHKVERLIHIELASKRAQGSGRCGTCGKEHREWFEVEGRRVAVKAIDEVVRWWVSWGERLS